MPVRVFEGLPARTEADHNRVGTRRFQPGADSSIDFDSWNGSFPCPDSGECSGTTSGRPACKIRHPMKASLDTVRPGLRERAAAFLARVDELPLPLRRALIWGHDLFVAGATLPLAVWLRLDGPAMGSPLWDMLWWAVPLQMIVYGTVSYLGGGSVNLWRFVSLPDVFRLAILSGVSTGIFYGAFFLVERLESVPGLLPVLHWSLMAFGLSAGRVVRAALSRGDPAAHYAAWTPVLLLGANEVASALVGLLDKLRGSPYGIVGVVDDCFAVQGRAVHGVPVLGRLDDLERVVRNLESAGMRPKVVVPTTFLDGEERQRLALRLSDLGLRLLDTGELVTKAAARCSRAAGVSSGVAGRSWAPRQVVYYRFRRLADLFVGGLALVLLSPFFAAIAVGIRLSLGSPVLFTQIRPGMQPRAFRLYKFRTLAHPFDIDGRPATDEERATPLTRFLRRTRLDELPQLWNVFKGDMSLIGPRPLLPRDLPPLDEAARHERFSIRPGLTGWAQVCGGHLLDMHDKLALDLWYIAHLSPSLDVRILWRTAVMVCRGERIDHEAVRIARMWLSERDAANVNARMS